MSAEAEKVISLSLCKIAETRGTRRGGTSLHKHLLIASVLSKATRARTAFLDTWYMGDETADGAIDLNMSYQDSNFSGADELDSDASGESSVLDIDPALVEQITASVNGSNSSECNSLLLGDPRFGTDAEGEIDLPPDILHCVEKLGGLNERIFSAQSASSSTCDSASSDPSKNSSVLFPPPVSSSSAAAVIPGIACTSSSPQIVAVSPSVADDTHEDSQQLTTTLTYLDLDAGSSIVERGPVVTSILGKRRREWCFDDEEDDDGGYESATNSPYLSKPGTANLTPVSFNNCKRLRFDDSGLSSPEKTDEEQTGVPSKCAENDADKVTEKGEGIDRTGSFRLSYEDVDGDDSDDDSFLEDALNQGLQSPSQIEMPNKTRHRNDRRVPSASSSSGSCSDEDGDGDGESSMEVDQITNLVQFISFNKQQQQSQSQNAANLRSISCVN